MATKSKAINHWWVTASENKEDPEHGWHWQEFFDSPNDPQQSSDWGGPKWINSTVSFARIKEMRRDDIIVAYQAGEGVVGLAYLASGGYQQIEGGHYDTFDLRSAPTIWLSAPVPFSVIRQLPGAWENIEFIRSKRGTVTHISKQGFDEIVKAILAINPSQRNKVARFLRGMAA